MKIVVINGPNLNLLGQREPHLYGHASYQDLERMIDEWAEQLKCQVTVQQSNHEGQMIDWIQAARGSDGLVINAAGYTHTSVAIRDAIVASQVPTIEVHLSNVFARESFRHHSLISPVARGVICGFGVIGYYLALQALVQQPPQ
jgi:3-dehydroquinate dehydratase II